MFNAHSTLFLSMMLLVANGSIETPETRLVKDLMKNYWKYAKPTINASDSVHLQFGAELVQIVSIMMPTQVMKTKFWFRLKWKNELLAWNSSDYAGIKSIRLNAYDVWTPDIQLYQEFDSSETRQKSDNGLMFKTQVILEDDGTTYWNSPATFSSSCELALADFPYDTQVCDMKFGPWSEDVSSLNMTPDSLPMLTDKYIESSEWELLSVVKKRNAIKYACCKHPYADVTITIKVRRKPLFYWFNMVIPNALLLLSLWVGYFVPVQSGERVSLSLVILLTFSIFVQATSAYLPRSAEIPSLSIFYFVVMLEVAASALVTCLIVSVHYTSELGSRAPMPAWLENHLLLKGEKILKKIGLLSMPVRSIALNESFQNRKATNTISFKQKEFGDSSEADYKSKSGVLSGKNEESILFESKTDSLWQVSVEKTSHGFEEDPLQSPSRCRGDLHEKYSNESKLQCILGQMKVITYSWREGNDAWESSNRWCRLAVVLDRLFFIIFSVFTVSTLLSFTVIRPALAVS